MVTIKKKSSEIFRRTNLNKHYRYSPGTLVFSCEAPLGGSQGVALTGPRRRTVGADITSGKNNDRKTVIKVFTQETYLFPTFGFHIETLRLIIVA